MKLSSYESVKTPIRNRSYRLEYGYSHHKQEDRDVPDETLQFQPVRHHQIRFSAPRNVDFVRPEYDLCTIANAVQLDGLLSRYVSFISEATLANGFAPVSPDEAIEKHIIARLKEISLRTGQQAHSLLDQIASQLATYGACYVLKVRGQSRSALTQKYRLPGAEALEPIVGLFVMEATTVSFGFDNKNRLTHYRQEIGGISRYHNIEDVIAFSINKIPGTNSGRSAILSVLDDVRALRKLEEEMEILGFQYALPLFTYKVGTDSVPAAPGEVDDVSATINSMPAYGMLVVPGHHTIECADSRSKESFAALQQYAAYFRSRIYAGLGVSPLVFSELSTSNRATSEMSSDITRQTIKRFQNEISARLETDLIPELLADGMFNIWNSKCRFVFPEPDSNEQQLRENGVSNLFINGLISRSEAREKLGYIKTFNDAESYKRLYGDSPDTRSDLSNKVAPANQFGKEPTSRLNRTKR